MARSRYMGVFASGRMASISQTSAIISTGQNNMLCNFECLMSVIPFKKLHLMVQRKGSWCCSTGWAEAHSHYSIFNVSYRSSFHRWPRHRVATMKIIDWLPFILLTSGLQSTKCPEWTFTYFTSYLANYWIASKPLNWHPLSLNHLREAEKTPPLFSAY